MSTTPNSLYGSYVPARPDYVNQYGVTDNIYGAILEPEIYSFLLIETGDFLLQESGYKLVL
jgi:hypothetical protein